jgi:IS5 family transposase
MNIDLNTIALVVLSAFSAFFGIGYIRARIADKFSALRDEMQNDRREMYAEHDRVYQRINRLEEKVESMTSYSSHKRYCNEKPMHDKNYYNSEV